MSLDPNLRSVIEEHNRKTPLIFIGGVWACQLLTGLTIPPNVPNYVELLYVDDPSRVKYFLEDLQRAFPHLELVSLSHRGYYAMIYPSTGSKQIIIRPLLYPIVGGIEVQRNIICLQAGMLISDVKFQGLIQPIPEQHIIEQVVVSCIEEAFSTHYKALQDRFNPSLLTAQGYVPRGDVVITQR